MEFQLCRATNAERGRDVPGDELVRPAMGVITHAITIDAPPERIWPWLLQLGSGRAGWYAYDHVDNGGIPSARRIIPELQQVSAGDILPSLPGARDSFVVSEVIPERALVLVVPLEPSATDTAAPFRASWALMLEPLAPGHTRLISRGRISTNWLGTSTNSAPASGKPIMIERAYALMARMPRWLLLAFAGTGHYIMESRMLRGIKKRSEGRLVESWSRRHFVWRAGAR